MSGDNIYGRLLGCYFYSSVIFGPANLFAFCNWKTVGVKSVPRKYIHVVQLIPCFVSSTWSLNKTRKPVGSQIEYIADHSPNLNGNKVQGRGNTYI